MYLFNEKCINMRKTAPTSCCQPLQKGGIKPLVFVFWFLCSIFCVLCSTVAADVSAAWERWADLPIASVEYVCDGEFSEDRVREATVIGAGDVYSRSRIRKSIEQIYSLREFSRIKVDAEAVENGVKLTFILTKQIETGNVRLLGSEKLDYKEIVRVMKLKPEQQGQEYDESIARMDVEAIRNLYRSRGYFDADVSFKTSIDEKSKRADVIFRVSEGLRPVVKEVIFLGTNRMVIKPEDLRVDGMKQTILGEGYKGQLALDLDARNIEKMYRERGYVTAEVKSILALVDPADIREYDGKGVHFPPENLKESTPKDGSVVIVVDIKQGKRVDIEIEVRDTVDDEFEPTDGIKESLAVYRMRSISEPVLRKSAEDIHSRYRSEGYYLAEVDHEVLEDRIWNFDTASDAEKWELSPDAPQVKNQKLLMDAGRYKKIQIRMKTNSGNVGRLHWVTNKGKTGRRDFSLISDDQFHNYEIDMRTFRITEQSMKNLRAEDVSSDFLKKLKVMENQKFASEKELEDALKAGIQEQNIIRLAMKHAERRRIENWSDRITQLRFDLSDVPGADIDVEWIKVKMTAESIPVVFAVTKNKLMKIKTEISVLTTQGVEPQVGVERIRNQMLTRRRHFFAFWPLKKYLPDGVFSETVFETDLRAIIALYKYEGYSQARIVHKDINPDMDKGEINLSVTIYEGPKTVVAEVILESDHGNILDYDDVRADLPSFQKQNVRIEEQTETSARYRIDPPSAFREETTVADRSYLNSRYADEGYFAQTEALHQFNDENTEVVITYRVTTGKQIRLDDETEIRGNHRTKRWVIERELSKSLLKNKIFNRSEVRKSWQNLLDLRFLEGVRVTTEPVGGADDLHKMIVDVTERDAISANLHLGSDSTAAFRAGLEASHINLWGTGRQASGKVQMGTEGVSFRVRYAEPWLLDRTTQGVVNIYRYSDIVEYLNKDGNRKRYTEIWDGGSAGISKTFYRRNTLSLGYKYEVVDYVDITDENESSQTSQIGSIETLFQRDTRGNPMNPTKGWLNAITLEYADKLLRGNESFAKITMNNMFYSRLSENTVLALGARTGYTWTLGGAKRVLTPKQFSLSDYTTPRGYDWTVDDAANLMLNVSMEIRFPIYGKIGGAIFYDSGYVFDELSDFNVKSMNSSVGLGLRIITPIGPVRLDYGYPVRASKNRRKLPHLAFGHAF